MIYLAKYLARSVLVNKVLVNGDMALAHNVVVLDFETTGLSPDNGDRAIEIGAVKIVNGEIVDTFQSLMNPGKKVNTFIEQYTGISNAMLSEAPSCQIVMNQFDLTLFDSFEVHITKEAFKQAFGVQRRPSKEDLLYFCDINRMFIVDHAQQFRNFNNAAVYYKVVLKKYNKAEQHFWVQEEPENMGPRYFVDDRIWQFKEDGYSLHHVSRVESGSPATGSKTIHDQELDDLMAQTFANW